MILKESLGLIKDIDDYRKSLYGLNKEKGISDPDVIKISQLLDEKIGLMLWDIKGGHL